MLFHTETVRGSAFLGFLQILQHLRMLIRQRPSNFAFFRMVGVVRIDDELSCLRGSVFMGADGV